MSRPTLYIAITNHGFGHATRAASVAGYLQQQNPDLLLILATTAPRWLLEAYIPGDFIYRPRGFDVGVIQSDSLTQDQGATLEKLREIRQKQNRLIASEVDFLKTNRVDLILADIPPLVTLMADAAGIPCWMMSNFGWDFIYRDWGGEFNEMADWIGDCFAQCDRLFRLPFHEPMQRFPHIEDMGLTGGTPRYPEDELRQRFSLTTPPDQTILFTFGGLGLQKIPYNNIREFPDYQFITFDHCAPDIPNLIKVSDRAIRPVDCMPLCGRVVSKPGFSTFSEALRLETPVVSLTRKGFAEANLLVNGLQQYGYHQILSPEAFLQRDWDFLRTPPSPPMQTSHSIATDGTERIAHTILDYFESGI
ncbi:glycosyl transferase [Spirulina sp. CS-785/01]|uniref:glycosyl transferase n=1 Tax=Spirulina sp. CS-785/01 TaxID=3021716 RepID=UPI00232ADD95|nr:glycosyl transferase [Spirulina sp. CS-785/01]MDB9312772.1 glycosyl transferase [Spirulina sp. CS-785/01]